MNYYIQGSPTKAEQIRAAFEKLGYDTSRHLFNAESVLYFTLNSEIRATTCNCTPAIIKTHPDYKELELTVKPNFKVGDWITDGICKVKIADINNTYTFTSGSRLNSSTIYHSYYWYSKNCILGEIESIDKNYHLWTIQDAKDGDVLVTTKVRSCPFIYRKTSYNNNLAYYYAGIDGNGNFCEGCLKRTLFHFGSVENVVPATKEQRDLLFAKMKEAGYTWDEKKKELKKIQHYDISNFQPRQWVLVRQGDGCAWRLDIFSHLKEGTVSQFECVGNSMVQCIPFEGNEHLLGTTDMCDEMYINW